MQITLNETPAKCQHIILEIAGRKILTTKQILMGAKPIDKRNLKINLLLNKLRVVIRKSGTTDWAKIKKNIELEDFDVNG